MAYQPLPTPKSLRAAAQAVAERGEPLIVMITLRGCVYCDLVRNSYLHPLMREGKAFAVQLDLQDRASTVQDFDGLSTSPAALAERWKIGLTPTLLFVGPDGRERAARLEGVSSTDFYGEYLNQRLDEARLALRK
jgi:thioredoxin-related protein